MTKEEKEKQEKRERMKERVKRLLDSDDDPDGENIIEKMIEALQKPKKHGVH